MDRITKSLQVYLKTSDLKYHTLFNSDTGCKEQLPTSTYVQVSNSDIKNRILDIIIDIFPHDGRFFISAHPRVVMVCKDVQKIKAFEDRWNSCRLLSKLSIAVDMGVIEQDCYCFQLLVQGICDRIGLSDILWNKYLQIIERETYEAWEKMKKLSV